MAGLDDIIKALQNNRNLDFVDRILRPEKYPVIQNPDGSHSTHLMSSSDNIAYPTIVRPEGEGNLTQLAPEDAFKHAIKSKQFITFPSEQEADQFASGGYKQGANELRKKTSANQQEPMNGGS